MALKAKKLKRIDDDIPVFDRGRIGRSTNPDSYFDPDARYAREYGDDDESLVEEIDADPDLKLIRNAALDTEADDGEEDRA